MAGIRSRSSTRAGPWSLLLAGALAACAASNPPAPDQPAAAADKGQASQAPPAQPSQPQPQPDSLRARYGSATIGSANVPVDRPYEQLTPDQQRAFKGWYERMGDADEPPFPVAGLKAIYAPIADAASAAGISGELFLEVTVDAAGTPQQVRVFDSPNPSVAQAMGEIAMQVQFKPARCDGQPCRMDFPVSVQFDQPAR